MYKHFLPEANYELDPEMDYNKLSACYRDGSHVVGKVTRVDSKNQTLEVYLGGNIYGTLPYAETTIYEILREDGTLSPNVYQLVGKTILAKIQALNSYDILLSRKAIMLDALESLKAERNFVFATIIGFSRISAFLDIGAGIIGRSTKKDFFHLSYQDIRDTGMKIGDTISVKVIEYFEETGYFRLSRTATLPPTSDLSRGDVVTCKVFDKVQDKDEMGYFVDIDKKFRGIVDSPDEALSYGDEVIAVVKGIAPRGAKLKFLHKMD